SQDRGRSDEPCRFILKEPTYADFRVEVSKVIEISRKPNVFYRCERDDTSDHRVRPEMVVHPQSFRPTIIGIRLDNEGSIYPWEVGIGREETAWQLAAFSNP